MHEKNETGLFEITPVFILKKFTCFLEGCLPTKKNTILKLFEYKSPKFDKVIIFHAPQLD